MISIITPIYNGQAFLKETIETVLNQSYSNWELLLIDDGSTDNSKAICETYCKKDNRIKYHYKPNGGQASARNLGINKAKGEWIALLDADDLWHPTKLEKQIKTTELYPEVTLCFTNTLAFEKNIDNILYTNDKYEYGLLSKEFFKNLYIGSYISNSSLLIKKEIIKDIGGFDENDELRGVEDWDLLLRLAMQKKRVFGLNQRLLYYRIHNGGIHLQNSRMFIGKTIVYNKYKNDSNISRLMKLRQYRYVYRELINFLMDENKSDDIGFYASELWDKDKFSFSTLMQKLAFKVLPLKKALWLSNKVIYRIGYRIERINYMLFLKK